jgi:hypothetical protein
MTIVQTYGDCCRAEKKLEDRFSEPFHFGTWLARGRDGQTLQRYRTEIRSRWTEKLFISTPIQFAPEVGVLASLSEVQNE